MPIPLLLLSLVSLALANWGPSVVFTSHTSIISFKTTLIPGRPPRVDEGFVAIWPGLWNRRRNNYDLVQSVTSSHDSNYMQAFCGARPGQWCTQVYVLRSGKPSTMYHGYVLDPNDQLVIEYERRRGLWWQRLTRNGKRLAEWTSGTLPATR